MSLTESAPPAVLAAQPQWNPRLQQATEGQRFRHAKIDRALPCPHLRSVIEDRLYFRMDVEIRWVPRECAGKLSNLFGRDAGIDFDGWVVATA